MKVLSVNIGELQEISFRGKTELSGYFKKQIHQPIFLGKTGVQNDSVFDRVNHGGENKACYLYSFDHYAFWKIKYPHLNWNYGIFGENITVEGMDESKLKIGDEIRIGDAIVQVTQPRIPCYKMGIRFNDQSIIKEFYDNPYPGFYVRVLKEGYVKEEDELIILKSDPESLSVTEKFKLK